MPETTSGLWTPTSTTPATSELTSLVELYDSEIQAIDRGPLEWARQQEGKSLNIHQFTRDLTEQFDRIGLGVDVQVWDANQRGVYIFKVEIQKRLTEWDPDRMVHEVQNNLLGIPGEGGVIDTDKAMMDFERRRRQNPKNKGGHFHA